MLSKDLLRWYDRQARDLPWRRSRDPYRIWLSEVMLQQTRVETATPYYERFLERFPTVSDLAGAAIDDVLALWSGLGYYRRARQLHAAAQAVAQAGGEFPRTAGGLLRLPGVGPYTAAAVASIAFGEVVPVLDGNVERVLCRQLALAEPPRRSAVRRLLLEAAASLLDPERPGESNQALMELGATVCKPRRPRCEACPLAAGCRAYAAGEVERYPVTAPRRRPERQLRRVAVVRSGERLLLFRRAEGSRLLAGTWELPWVEDELRGEQSPAALEEELGRRYGGRWQLGPRFTRLRQTITYRAITLEVHWAEVTDRGELAEGAEARWLRFDELERIPTSAQVNKVVTALRRDDEGQRSLWA